jgi:Protein of unknown function (DUF2937)
VLRSYARLVLFSLGLLVGIQVPNFVEQYTQRVNAHELEAEKNFSGFQVTADTYFHGDVDALIAHHVASTDRVFHDEAKTIAALYSRLKMWRDEWAALNSGLLARIAHVIFKPNAEVRREVVAAYSYNIPLTPPAIASGILTGLVGALIFEIVVFGLFGMLFAGFRPARPMPGNR